MDPAATAPKATDEGPLTETTVPLPESATVAGATPLYGTDSDPDENTGATGENCTITVQLFFGNKI